MSRNEQNTIDSAINVSTNKMGEPASLQDALTATSGFSEFQLAEPILRAITEAGFTEPTPVQSLAIPVLLQGDDATVMAATGTGKTAAYGLPTLQYLLEHPDETVLVMSPTRELANQISDELYKLGRFANIRSLAIYGGKSYSRQTEMLKRGVQIIVATPGRLLDLLDSGRMKFSPSIVILDEADEMLDMGFLEDIERIMQYATNRKQTLLFSATLPEPIQRLVKKFLNEPVKLKAAGAGVAGQSINQTFYVVADDERDAAALRLIESMNPEKCIVFCKTREETDRLTSTLLARSFSAAPLHGDIDQSRRERTIRDFRQGRVKVLVATDVAARGLDVADISHVFNYHIPGNPESYVHRIGRTGRAGRSGEAITFLAPNEIRKLRMLRQAAPDLKPAMIPTLRELRRRETERVCGIVIETEPSNEAAHQIQRIMTEQGVDAEELAARCLTLLIRRDAPTGAEKIGWSVDQINEYIGRSQDSKKKGGDSRRSSNRRDRSNYSERPKSSDRSKQFDKPKRSSKAKSADKKQSASPVSTDRKNKTKQAGPQVKAKAAKKQKAGRR